jgi:hypothetical protein
VIAFALKLMVSTREIILFGKLDEGCESTYSSLCGSVSSTVKLGLSDKLHSVCNLSDSLDGCNSALN